MAKEPSPAFQFYPSDWIHDLDEHPLEIEGAWIRICCKLFFSETCGSSEKSLANWARVMRVGERKCKTIIDYLDKQKIADVYNQSGSIRITSRRMVKDARIREIRRSAGLKGGNPALKNKDRSDVLDNQNLDNQTGNQKPTPSSSSSIGENFPCTQNNLIFKTPTKPKKTFQYTEEFEAFWQAYPKRIGKGKAFEEWRKVSVNGRPSMEEILQAIESQKASEAWTKDGGQYIPLPATWIHQRRWDDAPSFTDPFKGKISEKTARTLENLDRWEEAQDGK